MKIKYIIIIFLIADLYSRCSDLLNKMFNIVSFHPLRGLLGILLWFVFGVISYFITRGKSSFPLSIAIFGGLIGMTMFLCFFQLLFLLGIVTLSVGLFSVYANIALILFVSVIILLIEWFFKRKNK